MIDEPNLVLPLATSYNERGVKGYTHAVTNSEDQRKLNCTYEAVKNPATGKGTLSLVKRPGVTIDSNTYGLNSQISFLALDTLTQTVNVAASFASVISAFTLVRQVVVFNTRNSNNNVLMSSTNTSASIISTSTGFVPAFVDMTVITNVPYVVLQTRRYDADAPQRAFFNGVSSLGAAWTEIVDGDFTGFIHSGKMEHLDGYAFILTSTNLIINSDLNSIANWSATSFLAKQIRQDRAAGLARLSNQILAFGEETMEAFYNAGGTTGSPLGRLAHLHQKIGLVSTVTQGTYGGTHYYATVEGRIYFVGRRAGGLPSVGVFAYDGSRVEKVSTPYIDKILSEKYATIFSVYSFGFQGQSGVSICWTQPGATTQEFIVFFPEWKEWFEWNSTVFTPVNDRGFCIGAGANPHKLYTFESSDNWQDDGTSYQWFTQFRLPSNGSHRNFMKMYGVDSDTDTSANDLTVEASDDDCASFYTLGTIDQTRARKINFRGGSFTKRFIRIGNTNARPSRIHNFLARING